MLVVNIIAAVTLAICVSWAALFAFCQYSPYNQFCNRDYAYFIAAGLAAAASLTTFLLHQHANAHALMQRKRRALPHIINRYQALENSAHTLWNVWNLDGEIGKTVTLEDMADYGWVVEFDGAYPVIIAQNEYYHWLLNVATNQSRFELSGKKSVVSPLSMRNNPGLSRKRLDAYVSLLEQINAIEYVNANVKRLKPAYAADVWIKIIKPLEDIKPLVRI